MSLQTQSLLKPYHLFEKLGERFVYALSSGRFYRVDEPTYKLLGLCLEHPLNEAKAILGKDPSYEEEQIEEIGTEIAYLAQNGLFDVSDYRTPDDQVERQLKARYSVPWTKIELALAETCNLACTYCYCSTCPDMPKQGLMSEKIAKRAIEWLFAVTGGRKEVGITFFGGEPLLNKPVFQFAMDYSQRLAKEHKKKVNYSMTTNGTLLDDMVIRYIKRHNFGLMVSLDGPPDVHNAQCPARNGSDSFEAAANGIKRLMEYRKAVTVRCTMTNDAPRMLDLIHFFEDFGFTRMVMGKVVSPVNPSPVDCGEEDFANFQRQEEEELLPWMMEQLAQGKRPKYFPYTEFFAAQSDLNGKAEPVFFRCGACRGTMTVGADGTLYPCHRYVGMSNFVMGHIDDGPDLDRARRFWVDYHNAVEDRCSACWARCLCNRPCPWEISTAEGGFHPPDEWACNTTYSFYERAAYAHYLIQRDLPETYEEMFAHKRNSR